MATINRQQNDLNYAQWLLDTGKVKGNITAEALARHNNMQQQRRNEVGQAMTNGTYVATKPVNKLSANPTTSNPYQGYIDSNTTALRGLDDSYGTAYQNYANQIVNNGALQAIENSRKNMTDNTNRQYDTNARNYYAQYRASENRLPERLSNLGVTGGASETAQLALMNRYSGNLFGNENARASALNSGNMQYDEMVANNSKELANQLASTYLSLAREAQANKTAQADKEYERAWNEEARKYERYMADKEATLEFCNMVGRYDNMLGYGWSQAMVDKANKAAQASMTSSGGGGGYSSGYGYGSSGSGSGSTGNVPPSNAQEELAESVNNAYLTSNAVANQFVDAIKRIYGTVPTNTPKTTQPKKSGGSGAGSNSNKTKNVMTYK